MTIGSYFVYIEQEIRTTEFTISPNLDAEINSKRKHQELNPVFLFKEVALA